MSKRMGLEHSPRIEEAMGALYSSVTPDTAFVAALERQLLALETAVEGPAVARGLRVRRFWARLVQPLSRYRWATVALPLLLALAVTVGAFGPQRVWAELQRLLGYVPGIGFVNLEDTRLLISPVEVTQGGVALRVEQVVARPDRTEVVIRSEGLPRVHQLPPHGAEEADFQARLRLPDGRTLASETWALRWGAATLEFPPLPDDVYRVTLELPRLPLVPAGAAPEEWAVPLSLRPATGELVAELFPLPYAPLDASDTHADITLRVLEVAHSPEETVLRLQVQWPDPAWQYPCIGGDRSPVLYDDLGHVYLEGAPSNVGSVAQVVVERIAVDTEATPTPTPTVPTNERTLAFAPVSPLAQLLTLTVDAIEFDVPAEGGFTVDLGDDPQVGDHWPLDVHLTVAGFPVHITGAQLVQEEIRLPERSMQRTILQFDIGPVPEQEGRALRAIHPEGEPAIFNGGGGGYSMTDGLRSHLNLREGQSIPTGSIRVRVGSAGVLIRGPWNVTWTIPAAEETSEARVAPVTLHPPNASQTRDGLTLRVNQVTQTDRLTAVMVALDDPPAGVALSQVLAWSPATDSRDLYLEDDRGGRYETNWGVAWRPRGRQTSEVSKASELSQTLSFQPVQPLARRVTLHVPTVELILHGPAAFDVIVPTGVKVEPRSDPPWPASEPWDVDIPLEVAGYRVHLTQARLEELNGTTLLMLTSDSYKIQPGDYCLTGLRPISLVAPDGQVLDLEQAFGFTRTGLAFDVVDPETGTVQPGRYHVELDGVTVAVQGPWTLAWTVPGAGPSLP